MKKEEGIIKGLWNKFLGKIVCKVVVIVLGMVLEFVFFVGMVLKMGLNVVYSFYENNENVKVYNKELDNVFKNGCDIGELIFKK